MGLPEKSTPPEAYSLSQMPTAREPALPPDWPAESASFRPPPHYVVLEALGNGGMGVLYKAEDTRLHRTVALKVLPLRFTNDPVAKERFLREARTASAVDHQNLCAIYDVGESEDGRLFLAMPCYQGETLRSRLARGPLPLDEALGIAKQVARGLAKAHRQGIVHRDIKPENLMITTDGVVKILDFGIAKLSGASDLTGTEHRIGTPSYMAPEQSRKGTVDSRADLWALGVVLYEMITGRRPFAGANPVAVLQAIQYGVPEPLAQLRPGVPSRLEKVVARLLMKNPKARYPDAESVLAELDGETAVAGRRSRNLWLAAGLAAALSVGLVAAWALGPRDRQPRTTGAVPAEPERLTNQAGSEWFPSLAPDGQRFAYAKFDGSDFDIYLQSVDGGSPVNLTASLPGDDIEPDFSPDGSRIAFRSERPDGDGIFLMSSGGGPARRLSRFGFSPAWSPDGKSILVATELVRDPKERGTTSQIWRIEVDSGQSRRLVQQDAVQPSWSPEGRRIAFWSVDPATGKRRIWTVASGGGSPIPPVPVTTGESLDWNPVWSSDGHLYFASNRRGTMGLWRISIDEETGATFGPAEAIATPAARIGFLSISTDGRRILYASQDGRANVERAQLDPDALAVTAPLSTVTEGPRRVLHARVSPAGDEVVISDVDAADQEDLFLVRADGTGEPRQLTRDPHKDRAPSWSPDGRRLFFSSNRSGSYATWTIGRDGSGLELLGPGRREPAFQPLPSPDGRWLASVGKERSGWMPTLLDLRLPAARRLPQPLVNGFFPWGWSPDGQWLAGVTEEGRIALCSPATRKLQRAVGRGSKPVWMHTRPALLFLDEWRIFAFDLRTGITSVVLEPGTSSSFTDLDLGPDDRMLYVVHDRDEGDVWMLSLD
ncbi:MAG: protein kinase domain-containing protein [Thermoanaerobaculia bacterium]